MWVGQEAAPDLVSPWLQYGVLGLLVLGLLLGWLWAKPAVDRIIRENEHLRERLDRCEGEISTELRQLRRDLGKLTGEGGRDP